MKILTNTIKDVTVINLFVKKNIVNVFKVELFVLIFVNAKIVKIIMGIEK